MALLAALLAALLIGTAAAQNAPGDALSRDLQFWEELAFWETVKDSADGGDLRAYLQEYPDGRFAELARVRLAVLRAETAADTAPAPAPATPASADADTSTNDGAHRYIARVSANVRAAPTRQARRLDGLAAGQQILVTGTVAGDLWYRVQLDDGRLGYVYAELLEPLLATPPAAPPGDPGDQATPPGSVFRDCEPCPEMVVIAAGEFIMGSRRRADEAPPRQVTIHKPFALGVFELGERQWRNCVTAGGCDAIPNGAGGALQEPRQPIAGVSWDDAQAYLRWLRELSGHAYRLPSEAEWEYAARAGADTAYWWGEQPIANRANCKNCGSRWDNRRAAPSGAFPANPFGLYDMLGNLREWTADCWNDDHSGAANDALARSSGDCSTRVLRGGAWQLDIAQARAARRSRYDRGGRFFLHGVRVARDL